MKKLYLIVLAGLMGMAMQAEIRNTHDAATIAGQFQSGSKHFVATRHHQPTIRWVHTISQPSSLPAAYVFSKGDNMGYIIVSAEDQSRDILGYTESGNWNTDSLPENMRAWLHYYAEEIAFLRGDHITIPPDSDFAVAFNGSHSDKMDTSELHTMILSTETAPRLPHRNLQEDSTVSPLLGGIVWNQSTPFNNSCPIDPDNSSARCYTGCVATATAQIMRVWKHPSSGTGSHSYDWEYGKQKLSASFAHTYNWSNMLVSYNGSYTATQATAVAALMSDVGIAMNMEYGGKTKGGSSTSDYDAALAMQKYFKYDDCMECISPTYDGQANFESYVEKEVRSGRPLLFSGLTTKDEGHAFVCDGLDSNGLFHINWGWGGHQNGYFALSALDPSEHGIGGAASKAGFNRKVKAFRYIVPENGYDTHVPQMGTSLVYANKQSCTKKDSVTITMHLPTNYGLSDWNGSVMMAVINSSHQIAAQIGETNTNLSLYACGWYFTNDFIYTGTFSSLRDGEYTIAPVYSHDSLWYYVTTPSKLSLTIRGNNAYIHTSNPLSEYSVIFYTATNGKVVNPSYKTAFSANIVSNTYSNGLGVIIFDEIITSIGNKAFNNCNTLSSITFPATVTNIGNNAFYSCNLQSLSLPDSLTDIGNAAFYHNPGITSITLPNSVKNIGHTAFAGSGITSITIPAHVTKIGAAVFEACDNLQSIIVHSENTHYDSRNSCNAIIETDSNTLIAGCKNTTIPKTVEHIGQGAFYYCTHLSSITIPSKVCAIRKRAFAGCKELTSITCEAPTPPLLGEEVFDNVPKTIPLYAPEASVDLYKNADQWKDFDVQAIPDTGIADPAGDNSSDNQNKIIQHGQLLIRKNGKTFTIQGAEVK